MLPGENFCGYSKASAHAVCHAVQRFFVRQLSALTPFCARDVGVQRLERSFCGWELAINSGKAR